MKASVKGIQFHESFREGFHARASTTSTEKESGRFMDSFMTATATEPMTEAASREASGKAKDASTETVVHVTARKLPRVLLTRPYI